MADQLCGPSNALQNFQKHSSVDRTLQQDRLTNRASPSQGFRSSPGPQAGLINQDFEAFQAGHNLQNSLGPGFAQHASSALAQPGPMAWANDFQRLNVSSPPPHFQQHPAQQPAQASWHQEFLQQSHVPGSSHMQQQTYNAPFERLSTIVPAQSPYQSMYGGSMIGSQHPAQVQAQNQQFQMIQQPVEAFDEEAFARAFDQAAQSEMTAQEAALTKDEVMLGESAEHLMDRDPAQDQARIGADLIHDPDGQPDQHKELQQDPDALARTAAELLQRVSGNQSEKFANSQFLQLMRQLRDKEVTVEGDKIVDVHESVEAAAR